MSLRHLTRTANWCGQAKRLATQLEIAPDILCVINADLASNRGIIIRPHDGWTYSMHFYEVLSYILQHAGSC